MKQLLVLFVCLFAAAALLAKYTAQTERAAHVSLHAVWTEGQAIPDTARVTATMSKLLVNDEDATDRIERQAGLSFDGLRTDRSVQVGAGPVLTYRTVTLYYLKMVADARANP